MKNGTKRACLHALMVDMYGNEIKYPLTIFL